MLQFDCTGLENTIVNCAFFELTTCSDPSPVGVICNMDPTGNEWYINNYCITYLDLSVNCKECDSYQCINYYKFY